MWGDNTLRHLLPPMGKSGWKYAKGHSWYPEPDVNTSFYLYDCFRNCKAKWSIKKKKTVLRKKEPCISRQRRLPVAMMNCTCFLPTWWSSKLPWSMEWWNSRFIFQLSIDETSLPFWEPTLLTIESAGSVSTFSDEWKNFTSAKLFYFFYLLAILKASLLTFEVWSLLPSSTTITS